jgi:two-component system cell cycle response regulator
MQAADELQLSVIEELWFGDFPDEDAEEKAAQSMVAMSVKVVGLRPFPRAVQKILTLSRDPNADIAEIAGLIESDSTFATRVLRLVNSAAMRTRTRCTSISHAVRLIGARAIGEMATALAALHLFDIDNAAGARQRDHAAVVGALARHLAVHLGMPTDDVYTCGLLHDLGKLFQLQDGEPRYDEQVLALESGPDMTHIQEREHYGYDHGVLAGHVLTEWKIPDPVPQVVAWHHQPARAFNAGGDVARMVALVRCADMVAHCFERGAAEDDMPRIARDASAEYLGLSEAQLSELWTSALEVAHEACDGRLIAATDARADAADAADDAPAGHSPQPKREASPREMTAVQSGRTMQIAGILIAIAALVAVGLALAL